MATFKQTSALAATVLAAGALLTGCGSNEWNGTWTGSVTSTNAETGGGSATVTIKGGDCSWTMTETTGEKNDAKCKQSGEDFKLADPLTGQDLQYTGQVNNDTLTLTPQNDAAEKVGVMVLQR